MGDSVTKPEFWIISLAIIIIFGYSLLSFGNGLTSNSEISLDDDSVNYLANYTKSIDSSGISVKAQDGLDVNESKNPLEKALSGLTGLFDSFAVFTLLKNVFIGLWSFISMMFIMPSFLIESLGLPLGQFSVVINVVSFILTLFATIIIVRLVK